MEVKKTALYLPVLTGVRCLAALLVFFFHYGKMLFPSDVNYLLNRLFDEFYIGVGVFFVLSGFVITYNYFDQNIFIRKNLVKFILKRVVRIFPLYILILSLYYLYYLYRNIYFSPQEYFLNFTLLKGYSSTYWDSGITQAWSLATEENFYLFVPFIFYLINKQVKYYKQIFFVFLMGLSLFLFFKLFPLWGLFGDFKTFAFNTFFGRCFEFFTGVIIAVEFKKNGSNLINRYGVKKYFFKKFTYVGIFFIIICICLQMAIKIYYGSPSIMGIFVNNFFVPLGVGCFLFGLIVEKTIVSNFFQHKFIVILGYSSFAFYLLHEGIIANYFMNLFRHNILLLLFFLQGISVIIFYAFEKPIKNYLTKYFRLQK